MDCFESPLVFGALNQSGGAMTDDSTVLFHLKPCEHRDRCESASTSAPSSTNSGVVSFTSSPVLAPHSVDMNDPIFSFNFMLPPPAPEVPVVEAEVPEDPVSRVNSPVHKAPRLHEAEAAVVAPVAAPASPRMTVTDRAPESPRTPRASTAPRSFSPPPLVTKRARPLLLQALQAKSTEKVRAILQQNPDAASDLFWDHKCEPPLCAAVRLQCSLEIIQLLVEHGANVEMQNAQGRSPAQIAYDPQPWERTQQLPLDNHFVFPQFQDFRAAMIFPQVSALALQANALETWRQEVGDFLDGQL